MRESNFGTRRAASGQRRTPPPPALPTTPPPAATRIREEKLNLEILRAKIRGGPRTRNDPVRTKNRRRRSISAESIDFWKVALCCSEESILIDFLIDFIGNRCFYGGGGGELVVKPNIPLGLTDQTSISYLCPGYTKGYWDLNP